MKEINSPALLFLLIVACTLSSACDNGNPSQKTSASEIEPGEFDYSSFIGNDFLIDDQHSYLGFEIKYFGYSRVRGRFNEFDGTLLFDPEAPEKTMVRMIIDVPTINTGNETRDSDLTHGSWFNTSEYPYAYFESVYALPGEGRTLDLVGNLTIKGITRQVTLHVDEYTPVSRDWAKNEQIGFYGSMKMNRQDYDVHGDDFWSSLMEDGLTQLSDSVTLEVNIHARRADYTARFEDSDAKDIRRLILTQFQANANNQAYSSIDSLIALNEITAGAFSTIGNTLLEWDKQDHALNVFNKKLETFGPSYSTINQLGITNLILGDTLLARNFFQQAFNLDSLNSKSWIYLDMISEE